MRETDISQYTEKTEQNGLNAPPKKTPIKNFFYSCLIWYLHFGNIGAEIVECTKFNYFEGDKRFFG